MSRGRILALDWGKRRIGLAATDELGLTIQGLPTLVRTNRAEDLELLENLIRERSVQRIVVGKPLQTDGSTGKSANLAEQFGRSLANRAGLRVEFVDERLTSHEARQRLAQTGTRRPNKADVDRMSAILILEDYLSQTEAAEG
jgi:putative Holliday junction resolvase